MLWLQTNAFLNSGRSQADLARLKEEISKKRPAARYPVIHNCEFVGFINAGQRVGCLLHPGLNRGQNLRGISHHGRESCDEARCTAYSYLSEAEARLVARAAEDWYLYGLCITDLDLVREFFELASGKLFEEFKPEKILQSAELLGIFQGYLRLKESWPYARNPNRFGKYYFVGSDYPIYKIDYAALGREESGYDRILNSLGSEFRTRGELLAAEESLEAIFEKLAGAYPHAA